MALLWPNIKAPSYPLDHIIEDPTIRTPFEDGSEQTRPRYTRRRETFVLRLNALSKDDYFILQDFLDQVKVGSVEFEWIHPDNGTIYLMKILSLAPFQLTEYGYYGEVTIRGVKKVA